MAIDNVTFVKALASATSQEFKDRIGSVTAGNIKNIGNTIDILPIIWENILMEIPTHVVSPGASSTELEGNGWNLNKSNNEKGNSELSKLKDLF